MLTFSETVLTLTIWVLAACGFFFALRGCRRRRREGKERLSL